MNASQNFKRSLRICAAAALCVLSILPGQAANTPEPVADMNANASATTDTNAIETLRAYLQLQEQLHATQLALERNRQETEVLAARNAEAVAARFNAIEGTLTAQRLAELNTMQQALQSNNHLLLIVGGTIAGIGFLVLLLTAYLQWRSIGRLAEFAAMAQSTRVALPPSSAAEAQLLGTGETTQSGKRLHSAMSQLEKRILELEHTTHGPTGTKSITTQAKVGESLHPNDATGQNGQAGQPDHVAVLLAKGQSLLSLDKAAEALECFNEILRTEPEHGEALVKKGVALEELRQPDEALRCYDRAIAGNSDLTIAYLQKGGLFNRLERYEEALQCYEQALHAQEKAHAA
jgi:tetratricopeptide (TPR) repeat protein